MKEKKSSMLLGQLGLFYGIIIVAINFVGFLISGSGEMPVRETTEYLTWLSYMNEHSLLISFFSIMAFVIPALICVLYSKVCKKENINSRIINIPLMYSIFGALGWILSFFLELTFLLILKFTRGVKIYTIVMQSFLNIGQGCLFISTFAFFCIDAIHRAFILPKYFPEGNLNKIPGTKKLSSKLLFLILYISISVFPIFFLSTTIYNFSLNYGFPISRGMWVVVSILVIFGIIIVINFSNYISGPLQKLRKATTLIKSSDYNVKVDVVSCDDFGELADNFNDMAVALDKKTKQIYAIQDSVIRGMAVMVESRDNSTGGHINRTSDCVNVFIKKLRETPEYSNLTDSFCKAMIKAAPMHDLGKIAVDDAILRKPGKFTDEEYEIMKKHSAEGARIVENVVRDVDDEEFKQIAINVAHYHHEKWDGNGYPEKISGEQIPFEARIMALADVFDALVSKRCYKDSMSYDKAFSIIQDSLGSHFDPKLGEVFVNCRKDLEELYSNYSVEYSYGK